MDKIITIDPNIRHGRPTLVGTRITLADVLWEFWHGYDIENIAQKLKVEVPDIKKAIEYLISKYG